MTISGTGDGTFDYYSFTMLADGVIQLDLDNHPAPSDDVQFTVYDSTGTNIVLGPSSADATTLLTAGTYVICVNDTGGGGVDVGDSYDLQISVENVLNAMPTQVAIYAGDTTGTLVVNPIDDMLLENSEPVTYTITGVNTAGGEDDISIDTTTSPTPNDNVVTVTITDDDFATVKIAGIDDGIEQATPVNGKFTVTMSKAADEDVWVPFVIEQPNGGSPDDADYGAALDYTFESNTMIMGDGSTANPFRVKIPEGSTTADIIIKVNNEMIVELTEQVTLRLIDEGSSFPNRNLVGPNGDSQITLHAMNIDSIDIEDVDQAYVIVNSNIDTAVEGGANGQWTITLAKPGTTGLSGGPPVLVTASTDTVVFYKLFDTTLAPVGLADPSDIDAPAVMGSITILAGQSTATIDLSAINDGNNEGTEDVFITLTDIDAGDSDVFLDPDTDNLFDDIFIIDANGTRVKIAATQAGAEKLPMETQVPGIFTVSLVGAALVPDNVPITVYYSFAGSTANNPNDFTDDFTTDPFAGQVVIPAGMTSANIVLPIIDDALVDPGETIKVTITSISYPGQGSPGSQIITVDPMNMDTMTIIDNEVGTVWINATDQTAGEGSMAAPYNSTFDGRFTVTLSNASSTGVTVYYSVITPTGTMTPHATEGSDYTTLSGSVFIQPNLTTATIDILSIDDAILEGTERVVVKLDSISSTLYSVTSTVGPEGDPGTLGDGPINGDRDYVLIAPDQTVTVTRVDDATEGVDVGNFRISLNRPSSTNTYVTYMLSNAPGDAVEGSDYIDATFGTATILAGNLSTLVVIDPITVGDDFVLENPENVTITLLDVTNTAPDAGGDIELSSVPTAITADLTIYDNDYGYVTIEAVDKGYEEGEIDGKFTVTLRGADGNPTTATEDITVHYTVLGTADPNEIPDGDYTPLTGSVVIPKDSSSAMIIIEVNDDDLLEGTETVTIRVDSVDSSNLQMLPSSSLPRVFVGALGGPMIMFQQDDPFGSGYQGTRDTYVNEADSLVNYGALGTLTVENQIPDETQGLIQFTQIFGFGFGLVPLGTAITSAQLDLTGSFSGPAARNISIFDMQTAWNEATISWDTALLNGNTLRGLQRDGLEAALLPTDTSATGTFTPFDVTDSLVAWLADPASNYGWALFASAGAFANINSSENTTDSLRPKLTVNLDTSATIEICDNDTALLEIDSWTAAAEESTDGVVTVLLSGAVLPFGYTVSIPWSVGGGGTAIDGSDYTSSSGTITLIGDGLASTPDSATFTVDVLGDFLIEGTETVLVSINPVFLSTTPASIESLITIGDTDELVDIIDDDAAELEVQVLTSGSELPTGNGLGQHTDTTFRVSLEGLTSAGVVSSENTTVSFTLPTNMTAGAAFDYIAPTTFTATILQGTQYVDVTINILDDLLNEDTEFITMTLTPGSVVGNPGITVSPTNASATDLIEDDDNLIADLSSTVTAGDEKALETPSLGDNGLFTISMNFASDQVTTVPFVLNGPLAGDASLPTGFDLSGNPTSADYTLVASGNITWLNPRTGYATFPASATPQTATIQVIAKQDFDPTEGNELVRMEIKSSVTVGATTVNLTNPNLPGSPNPPVVAGAGDQATVTICDETYIVSLANTDSPAKEDGFPIPGNGFNGQFTVSISNPTQSFNPVTVSFDVANFPANQLPNGTMTATYGVDYRLIGPGVTINPVGVGDTTVTGTVVIPGGQSFALITIEVLPDSFVEGYLDTSLNPPQWVEDVKITLTAAQDALPGNIAAVSTTDFMKNETIIDNDEAEVTISVVDDLGFAMDPLGPGIGEGDGVNINQGAFRFSTNKPAQGRDIRVAYSIVTPSGNPAELADHGIPSSGFVTIPAGSSFVDLKINPVDDNDVEGPENLKLMITSVTEFTAGTTTPNPHALIGPGATLMAQATIMDNDAATISIIANDNEATESAVEGQFKLTMSQPAEVAVTVTYTVGGGTDEATPGMDYVALSGTVTFTAGSTMAFIDVEALQDLIVEGDESVTVTLNPMTNLSLVTAAGTAQVFIRSDDIATATLAKVNDANEEGMVPGQYSVTLDHQADEDLTFMIMDMTSVGPGFAVTPGDYSTSAMVTIPANTPAGTPFTILINPVDDAIAEGNETLTYKLKSVSDSFTFVLPTQTSPDLTTDDVILLDMALVDMEIIDNDVPVISVSDVTMLEGTGGGPTIFTFTVSLDSELAVPFTVQPFLSTNTTFGGGDYGFPGAVVPGPFTFPAGPSGPTTTFMFNVEVDPDIMQEADETFTVDLTNLTMGPATDGQYRRRNGNDPQ